MNKLLLLILICTIPAVLAATPSFEIAIGEDAPITDVILAAELATEIQNKDYTLPSGITKNYADIDENDLEDQVTLILYDGEAVILVGEDANEDSFIGDLKDVLSDNNVPYDTVENTNREDSSSYVIEKFEEDPQDNTQNEQPEETDSEPTPELFDNTNTQENQAPEACNGCTLDDNNCLAVGERALQGTTEYYCSESTELLTQKEKGASCTHNYECRLNICDQGTCGLTAEPEYKQPKSLNNFVILFVGIGAFIIIMIIVLFSILVRRQN